MKLMTVASDARGCWTIRIERPERASAKSVLSILIDVQEIMKPSGQDLLEGCFHDSEHAAVDANLSARFALSAHEVHVIRDSRALQDEGSCRSHSLPILGFIRYFSGL